MSDLSAAGMVDPAPIQVPSEVRSLRRRQALLWLLALAVLALLALLSAGFFLYAAVVTAAVVGIGALLPAASLLGLEVRRSLGATPFTKCRPTYCP